MFKSRKLKKKLYFFKTQCFLSFPGVHLVANVQPHVAEMKFPLIGAYIGLPWLLYDSQNLVYSALISAIFVNWKGKEWEKNPQKPRKGFCRRLSTLTLCGLIYLTLWGATIYLNASVTTKDGQEIPLREAIPNFFNSPAWADTKQTFRHIYEYYKVHGFNTMWEEIMDKLDASGEDSALKVGYVLYSKLLFSQGFQCILIWFQGPVGLGNLRHI